MHSNNFRRQLTDEFKILKLPNPSTFGSLKISSILTISAHCFILNIIIQPYCSIVNTKFSESAEPID